MRYIYDFPYNLYLGELYHTFRFIKIKYGGK